MCKHGGSNRPLGVHFSPPHTQPLRSTMVDSLTKRVKNEVARVPVARLSSDLLVTAPSVAKRPRVFLRQVMGRQVIQGL